MLALGPGRANQGTRPSYPGPGGNTARPLVQGMLRGFGFQQPICGERQKPETGWRSEVNSNCRYLFLNNQTTHDVGSAAPRRIAGIARHSNALGGLIRSATFEGDIPSCAMNDVATDVAAAFQ